MASSTLTFGYFLLKRAMAFLIAVSSASPPKAMQPQIGRDRRRPRRCRRRRQAEARSQHRFQSSLPIIGSSLSRFRVACGARWRSGSVETFRAVERDSFLFWCTKRFEARLAVWSWQARNGCADHQGRGEARGRRDLDGVGGDQPLGAGERGRHRPGRAGDRRDRLYAAGAAQTLRSGRSRLIGLIVPDITNPHFSAVARVVENDCLKAGYMTFVYNTDEDTDHEMRILQDDADAARRRPHPHLDALRRPARPAADGRRSMCRPCSWAASSPERPTTSSRSTTSRPGAIAARRLLDLGHRRIVVIGGRRGRLVARAAAQGLPHRVRRRGLDARRRSGPPREVHRASRPTRRRAAA